MLTIGIKGELTVIVTEENSAASVGSGLLPVFATPAMITLMEAAAYNSVAEYLDEGQGTVGTLIDVKHLAATPVGMEVRCESQLVEIDRKRLVFKVEVFDQLELVGTGIHERFIIDNEKFMGKTLEKMRKV